MTIEDAMRKLAQLAADSGDRDADEALQFVINLLNDNGFETGF